MASSLFLIVLMFVNGLLGFSEPRVRSIHLAHQPYRTGYHFQPRKNWMNDPCGPVSYKGIYHLFYQYNPNRPVWGTPVWGHSTSTDLVNWTPQPVAIGPQTPANIRGSWTGSTTMLPGNKPVILFTGINPRKQQVQDLAVPKNLSDPYLREWVLVPQDPVMFPIRKRKINDSAFRDPTSAWMLDDGQWRVLVGNQWGNQVSALLWRSKDFVQWVEAKYPFFSGQGTRIWECLDLFPVYVGGHIIGADTSVVGPKVKHVLKISLDETKHDIYSIGTYDFNKDLYIPEPGFLANDSSLRYDYGKYYASKSFFDSSKKRRVLFSWVNESSSRNDDLIKGWSGIQAIPRTIALDKSGKQLVLWPINELETLRENRVSLPSQLMKPGSMVEVFGVTASQADVEISFRSPELSDAEEFNSNWTNPQMLCAQKGASVRTRSGPFGVLALASRDLEEHTAIFFRLFKASSKYVVLMCSDQSRSSLNPKNDRMSYGTLVDVNPDEEELSLRLLIDHSVVESFAAGGKSVITARVYPTLAIGVKAHLYVFNNGSRSVEMRELNAWSMKTAKIA